MRLINGGDRGATGSPSTRTAAGHSSGPRKPASAAGPGALAAALALLLLAACGGKIPPTHYYVLNLPAPEAQPAETLPYTAVVMPLRASQMLSQDRIVYRESESKVGFYEYHRWAEDPRTSILQSLMGELRAKGTFSRVVPFDGRTNVDYIIRGQLEQLEEIDYGQGVSVRARVSLQLVDSTNRPVWTDSAEAAGNVSTGEVQVVVDEMSTAMRAAVGELASGIDSYLRSSAAQSGSSSARSSRGAQR